MLAAVADAILKRRNDDRRDGCGLLRLSSIRAGLQSMCGWPADRRHFAYPLRPLQD
jgi:hypothetical protein